MVGTWVPRTRRAARRVDERTRAARGNQKDTIMNIGIVGGTGREGRGIALRWAKAGHRVTIGSRDATRGAEMAAELSQKHGVTLHGTDNAGCCEGADVVLLAIPYRTHGETLPN